MPPYPNELSLPGCEGRARNICQAVVRQAVGFGARDIIAANIEAIEAYGAGRWAELWAARGDGSTPASVRDQWTMDVKEWAASNLIPAEP